MHERQAAVAVICLLFFSIIFTSDSFAQVPQCDGLDATHVGTDDKDKIRGTSGDDVIVGLGGNDIIYGKGGNDVICGGSGNDKIFGSSGNDILLGETGSDKLYGGQGIDTCDSSSDDKKVISCETPYIQSIVSDASKDLQKQITDLQNQLNKLVLGLMSWTDIQGIPESLSDGDDDMLGNISCESEQILVFIENAWVCTDAFVKNHIDTNCNDGICEVDDGEDEPIVNTDVLGELNCQIDEIAKWDGNEWICSNDDISSTSPIFFHWSTGRGTEWLGVSTIFSNGLAGDRPALVMPQDGTISNLYANLGKSGDAMFPGIGESFILTLVKNDVEETSLSCIMTDLMSSCSDSEHLVSVFEGDTIVLRMDATEFSNDAVIRSSILLSIP